MGTFHGSPSPIPVKTRLKVDALSDCHNLAQFGPRSNGSPLDSSIHNHHDLPRCLIRSLPWCLILVDSTPRLSPGGRRASSSHPLPLSQSQRRLPPPRIVLSLQGAGLSDADAARSRVATRADVARPRRLPTPRPVRPSLLHDEMAAGGSAVTPLLPQSFVLEIFGDLSG